MAPELGEHEGRHSLILKLALRMASSPTHPKEIEMKSSKGFTLVELMIVIAVIAILSAIAIPAYNDYLTRGKLAEGIAGLSDGRVKMEQFFLDNKTYVGGPTPGQTTNFSFSLDPAPTASTYTIKATGKGSLSSYSYTINESNIKTSNTPWGNSTSCWVIKKGGGC